MQLRFASLAVTSSRRDFHPLECAHAGRTNWDRGRPFGLTPPTPPGMRVRTGRFEKLRFAPCSLFESAGVGLHHCLESDSVSPHPLQTAPPGWTSDAISNTSPSQGSLLLVRSFTDFRQLLRPLLTSRSGSAPSPFRHKARSPQVRTHSFTARPPDLRRLPLVTRASRLLARSPRLAPPSIRFLFIGPQLRSTLPPHTRSPSCSCASLRSL
jgi:hypothetical protein